MGTVKRIEDNNVRAARKEEGKMDRQIKTLSRVYDIVTIALTLAILVGYKLVTL